MLPMYGRMDLEVLPNQARGSFQCRVSTPEKTNVIRTIIFFDDSDTNYTPISVSLIRNEPDSMVKNSDIEKNIHPLKLECALDGLENDDLARFEMSPNQARSMGDMTAQKGKYYFTSLPGFQICPIFRF